MSNLFNNLGIDVGFVIILLMIIAIVLIVLMMMVTREMKRMQIQYRSFMKGMDGASLEKNFRSKFSSIDKVGARQLEQKKEMDLLRLAQNRSLSKYGIVKYDAFGDVGGKMSFVLAMLDSQNTGFVINAIHSKENCFVYIKEVVNGESYIALSQEEIEALRIAGRYGTDEDIIAQYEQQKN